MKRRADRKRSPSWLILFLFVTFGLISFSLYASDSNRISVGVVADNEPYSWMHQSHPAGFSIDVLEKVANLADLTFEYRVGSWPEVYAAFLRGEVDVIDEISWSEERAKSMLFTEPYHYRNTVVMQDSNRPLDYVQSIDHLRPYRIGILKDVYYSPLLYNQNLELVEYELLPNLVRALAFGWVDAIIGPDVTLQFLAQRAGFRHLDIAGVLALEGVELEDFRLAVLKDKSELHAKLEKALQSIEPEWLADLTVRWQEYGGKHLPLQTSFQLSQPEIDYIRQLGPVRVGLMRDYAPFSFLDGGSVQGLSVDILKRIQDLTGLQVIPVVDQWSNLIDWLEAGELDVLANMSFSEERQTIARFSDSYYIIPNVLFSKDLDWRYTDPSDLKGLRVAIGAGIFYEQALRDIIGDSLFTYMDQASMFNALANNHVDAVIAALPNGNHWVSQLRMTGVYVAGELILEDFVGEDLRFGVKPSLAPLADILNKTLNAITPIEQSTIQNRWLGSQSGMSYSSKQPLENLSEEELAYLSGLDKTIRICVHHNQMPLEAINQKGHLIGVSSSVVEHLSQRLDLRIELFPMRSRSASLRALSEGGCDAIPMLSGIERIENIALTRAYYSLPAVILGRIEVPFINSLNELSNQRVGVLDGFVAFDSLVSRYPNVTFVSIETEADGLRQLQSGNLNAFISSLPTASHTLQELGIADIRVIGRVPFDWNFTMAVQRDNEILLGILQKFVDSLTDEDRLDIENVWRTVKLEESMDWSWIWRILTIAVLIVLMLAYWNRRLGALNAKLALANEKLAYLSVTDELTGLGNRAFFDHEYGRLHQLAVRQNQGVMVAMLDVDHFKRVNDTFGHAAGDHCLQFLAASIKQVFKRDTDYVARYGGEEFVIFTLIDSSQNIYSRCESLRQLIEASKYEFEGQMIAFTVSIGLHVYCPQVSSDPEHAMRLADTALYKAKSEGRNRVVMIDTEQKEI
ncbi:transporter substrate-binding domain-containing protein [Nitrincola tibetensis]|uniref:transporter substrate-binding domain-containing protein n=1 Tax=Nitrincola tibetensis TaxID=2219697 RepID=UPI0010580B8E|nr:transporter substrate-binding domain-containing protein [Nitrincola tibetensis]